MIILDTHIWFWFINQEFNRFPARWKDLIEISPRITVSQSYLNQYLRL